MQDDVSVGLTWTNADSVRRVKRVEARGDSVTRACELLEVHVGT